ncbi:MAG: UDP-N-acetylglucosamine 2-epimerase [Arsenophonus sp.]
MLITSGGGLKHTCHTLIKISKNYTDVPVIYQAHLNHNVTNQYNEYCIVLNTIILIDEENYLLFIYLMNIAYLILTDSLCLQ